MTWNLRLCVQVVFSKFSRYAGSRNVFTFGGGGTYTGFSHFWYAMAANTVDRIADKSKSFNSCLLEIS